MNQSVRTTTKRAVNETYGWGLVANLLDGIYVSREDGRPIALGIRSELGPGTPCFIHTRPAERGTCERCSYTLRGALAELLSDGSGAREATE